MRRLGPLTLVLLGCSANPAPTPAPSATPATASEPRLGRAAEAAPPPAEAREEPAAPQAVPSAPLPEFATLEPPPNYRVRVATTVGDFVIAVDRNLAPHGAKRFYNLVQLGYFRDVTFFRAIPGFMVQFGLHGDPAVNDAWKVATIADDPVNTSNLRGAVAFAKTARPDTANTQLFINLGDNAQLDQMGFAPIGHVVEGMDTVDKIHTGYGEGGPRGQGPSQARIHSEGNAYLEQFPLLTRIVNMSIM